MEVLNHIIALPSIKLMVNRKRINGTIHINVILQEYNNTTTYLNLNIIQNNIALDYNLLNPPASNPYVNPTKVEFLLHTMENDDITLVSEGLVGGLDPNLWNLEYVERCRGESYFHKIRVFHRAA